MPICRHCSENFTEEDLKEAGIDLSEEMIEIEDLDVCPECARGIADFEGDFNLFHPDETEEEFSDHED